MAGEGFNDPNTTQAIMSSRVKIPATEYVGDQGRLFYHEDTGELRISDGVTPHGRPIYCQSTSSGAVTLSLYASSGNPPNPPQAFGDNSTAIGAGAQSYAYGAINQAAGSFTNYGDAQTGSYIARNITTNNTPTELFLNGSGARLVIQPNTTLSFTVCVTARRTDSAGQEGAVYEIRGAADCGQYVTSVSLIGLINKVVVTEDNPAWDFNVDVNNSTGALRVWATGENGKTIRWVANIQTVEVRN